MQGHVARDRERGTDEAPADETPLEANDLAEFPTRQPPAGSFHGAWPGGASLGEDPAGSNVPGRITKNGG